MKKITILLNQQKKYETNTYNEQVEICFPEHAPQSSTEYPLSNVSTQKLLQKFNTVLNGKSVSFTENSCSDIQKKKDSNKKRTKTPEKQTISSLAGTRKKMCQTEFFFQVKNEESSICVESFKEKSYNSNASEKQAPGTLTEPQKKLHQTESVLDVKKKGLSHSDEFLKADCSSSKITAKETLSSLTEAENENHQTETLFQGKKELSKSDEFFNVQSYASQISEQPDLMNLVETTNGICQPRSGFEIQRNQSSTSDERLKIDSYTSKNLIMNSKIGPSFFNQNIHEDQKSEKVIDMLSETSLLKDVAPIIKMADYTKEYCKLPIELQTYFINQLILKSHMSTLQVLSNTIKPVMKVDFLKKMPLEITLRLLRFFNHQALYTGCAVSKKWHQIITKNSVLWERAVRKDEQELKLNTWVTNEELQLYGLGHPRCLECNSSGYIGKTDYIEAQASILQEFKIEKQVKTGKEPFRTLTDSKINPKGPCLYETGKNSYKELHKYRSRIKNSWNSSNFKKISFKAHSVHVVTCMQFDDEKIITGSDDQDINIYKIKSGKFLKRLTGHEGGVWCLEHIGNILASGSTDRTVRIWDIEKGICTNIFLGHVSTVRCLQIVMPEHKIIQANQSSLVPSWPVVVTGSRDSTLRVWRLPTALSDRYSGKQNPENEDSNKFLLHVLRGHSNSVRTISAKGKYIISGSYDNTVRMWDIVTGECVHQFIGHTQKVYSVVYDDIRKVCMSGSLDGTIRVWNTTDGTCKWVLEGHTSLVGILEISKNYLVSAAADSTIRVWDINTGECLQVLHTTVGVVTTFQHCSKFLVSGSEGVVKLFDISTGKLVSNLVSNLSGVWQIKTNYRYCVIALQKLGLTRIEVLDFGGFI